MINFFILESERLYEVARKQGIASKIWSTLTRHSQSLLDLDTIRRTVNVSGRHYAGIQTVSIEQIRGSEGRSKEFDAHFRPLKTHTRRRWINIAVAQKEGQPMPAVKLIRIGNIYFVRDGHHRISVSQVVGQEQIEAAVTIWETTGTLPWEPQVICDVSKECSPMCRNVCA